MARPEITQTHRDFYKNVSTAAVRMTELTRTRATEQLGGFPSEESYALFEDLTATTTSFKSKDSNARSRTIRGGIAGSDAFAINSVSLPEEGERGKKRANIAFPGRIIDLELFFGDEDPVEWNGLLYAGREVPPVIVEQDSIEKLGIHRPSEHSIASANDFIQILPENKLIFPDERELNLVLGALTLVEADIDVSPPLRDVYNHYKDNDPNPGHPAAQAQIQWFRQAAEQF